MLFPCLVPQGLLHLISISQLHLLFLFLILILFFIFLLFLHSTPALFWPAQLNGPVAERRGRCWPRVRLKLWWQSHSACGPDSPGWAQSGFPSQQHQLWNRISGKQWLNMSRRIYQFSYNPWSQASGTVLVPGMILACDEWSKLL